MENSIAVSRYLVGLQKRLSMGKNIILREDILSEGPLSSNDISLNSLWSYFDDSKQKPIAFQICAVCLKLKSIPEQIRFLSQFSSHPAVALARVLTIGRLFQRNGSFDGSLEDGDYSIVSLPEIVSDSKYYRTYIETRARVRRFMSDCGIASARNIKSLTKYLNAFKISFVEIKDLQRLGASFQQLKEDFWPLVGADLLSGLQALCDPLHEFSAPQLRQLEKLAGIWALQAIFYKLCLLRALGGYKTEIDFFAENHSRIGSAVLNRQLLNAITALLSEQKYEGYIRCTAGLDLLTFLLSAFANIALASRNRDEGILKRQIAQLYQKDSQAHLFLNWEDIHQSFVLPASESDVYTIFLKLLMLNPSIGKRFLTVAIARGKGHLVADLSSFISRIRIERASPRSKDRGNTEFIRRIRKLPRAAAARLIEDVLDRGMMERLAFAFPTSLTLAAGSLPRVDHQASILRLELANLSLRANALPERIANRIIEEETHFLRMHRFHSLFREGRIKIDWAFLAMMTEVVIEDKFEFLLSDKKEEVIDTSVLANVIQLFSEELSDILLFDSESSLEQALNNNVRHGVLVPRFIKCFNEALVAAIDFEGHPGDLSDDTYKRFGKNSEHLLKLKEGITERVTRYKDYWLTVERHGEFHQSTRALIREAMEAIGPDTDSRQLSQSIVEKFEPRVDAVLKQALKQFLESLKPSILSDMSDARNKCSKNPSVNATTFLDILESSILNAFDEIKDWLGLAKVTANIQDFELIDLIRFEAVSLIFSDFKKLHFRHTSFVRKNGELSPLKSDPRIKGTYFEVTQEIVHNLISNSLKHSGLGMNTDINLSVIVDDSDLVFRCSNSFSSKNRAAIEASARAVNEMIRTSLPSQGRRDSLSGFSKIKNVCSRVLFEAITINVPPIPEKTDRYIVEIRIPNVTGYMLG